MKTLVSKHTHTHMQGLVWHGVSTCCLHCASCVSGPLCPLTSPYSVQEGHNRAKGRRVRGVKRWGSSLLPQPVLNEMQSHSLCVSPSSSFLFFVLPPFSLSSLLISHSGSQYCFLGSCLLHFHCPIECAAFPTCLSSVFRRFRCTRNLKVCASEWSSRFHKYSMSRTLFLLCIISCHWCCSGYCIKNVQRL